MTTDISERPRSSRLSGVLVNEIARDHEVGECAGSDVASGTGLAALVIDLVFPAMPGQPLIRVRVAAISRENIGDKRRSVASLVVIARVDARLRADTRDLIISELRALTCARRPNSEKALFLSLLVVSIQPFDCVLI